MLTILHRWLFTTIGRQRHAEGLNARVRVWLDIKVGNFSPWIVRFQVVCKVGNFSSAMDLRNRAVSPYRGQENARKKGQSEMALRLEPFGIHVIIIEPGYFRTDSLDSSSVPLRRHRQYGVNNSPENLHKGFTHVYLITFENADARDAYLPHPEHKKFGELLGK